MRWAGVQTRWDHTYTLLHQCCTISDVFHWGNHPILSEIKTRKTGPKGGNETRLDQTRGSYSFHQSSVTGGLSHILYATVYTAVVIVITVQQRDRDCCVADCGREVGFAHTVTVANYISVTIWTLNINCLRLLPLCCWSPLNGTLYTDTICHSYLLSSQDLVRC